MDPQKIEIPNSPAPADPLPAEALPPETRDEAAGRWFGYIGFGIVIVALFGGLALLVFAVWRLMHSML